MVQCAGDQINVFGIGAGLALAYKFCIESMVPWDE